MYNYSTIGKCAHGLQQTVRFLPHPRILQTIQFKQSGALVPCVHLCHDCCIILVLGVHLCYYCRVIQYGILWYYTTTQVPIIHNYRWVVCFLKQSSARP